VVISILYFDPQGQFQGQKVVTQNLPTS